MPSLILTDIVLKRVRPPATGQVMYFDQNLPGFIVSQFIGALAATAVFGWLLKVKRAA